MTKNISTDDLLASIIKGIEDVKGLDIDILDLRGIDNSVCDYFVICNGNSNTQVNAIVGSVQKGVSKELKDKPWYIYNGFSGTSEERNLVGFLKDTMGNFEAKNEKVFLLRNEEVYKIYDFEKGRGFQPDFLLFLKSTQEEVYYQVFIEPKGSQFEDASGNFKDGKEGWKETFLDQITEKYSGEKLLKRENHFYKLIGLPLYNNKNDSAFKKSISKNLEIAID